MTLDLPPLRERGDDVLLLAEHFLSDFCRKAHRKPLKFSAAARQRLEAHSWPGNIRELRNLMERLAYLSTGERIEAEDLAFILSPGGEAPPLVAVDLPLAEATDQFQIEYIKQAHRARQRQHERSRQAAGPAPLEPVSQDAAARHADRRRRRQAAATGSASRGRPKSPRPLAQSARGGTMNPVANSGKPICPLP